MAVFCKRPEASGRIQALDMDDEEIKELYRRLGTMVTKRVPESAEDVIQDSVMEAWIHRDEVQNEAYFPGWSASIARNHINDCFRHAEAEARMLQRLKDRNRLLLGNREQAHFAFEFSDAIAELPDHYREILYLYLIYGFSMPEIAAMLDITICSARGRYRRAKKRLAKIWTR